MQYLIGLIVLVIFVTGLITPINIIRCIYFDGPSVSDGAIFSCIITYTFLFFIIRFFIKEPKLPKKQRVEYKTEQRKKNEAQYLAIYNKNKRNIDSFIKNVMSSNKYDNQEKIRNLKEILAENNNNYDIGLLENVISFVKYKNYYDLFVSRMGTDHRTNKLEDIVRHYLKTFEENSLNTEYKGYLYEYLKYDLGLNIKYDNLNKEINKCYNMISSESRKQEFRKDLYDGNNLHDYTMNRIDAMDGNEFEDFLYSLFLKMGYKAVRTKASHDQGADLLLEKLGQKTVVQAKCYSSTVGNKAVQEVVAARTHYRCDYAMVVSNSFFTKQAKELASSNNVELVDRHLLQQYISKYYM